MISQPVAQLAFDFTSRVAAPATPVKSAKMAADTTRRLRGRVAYLSGDAAEIIVARTYERRGFHVARRRWRGPAGEIDLIINDGASLIFVEVKKSRSFEKAAENLTPAQMQRIYTSAECYLGDMPQGQLTNVRFDVALVDQIGDVRIVENAFGQF